MSEKVLINISTMEAFADWIRSQKGTSATMLPSEMLAALETIVGLPGGIKSIATGTFTPSSNQTGDYAISHGLGETPDFYVVYITSSISTAPSAYTPITTLFCPCTDKISGQSYTRLFMYSTYYSSAWRTEITGVKSANVGTYATSSQIIMHILATSAPTVIGKLKYRGICGKFA